MGSKKDVKRSCHHSTVQDHCEVSKYILRMCMFGCVAVNGKKTTAGRSE